MSKISIEGNVSGSGTITIAAPNTNSNFTLTLPTETGTILTGSGNQAGSFTTLNTSGQVVFNDAGANVDFRVEGDTDANLLFVDASTDRVGIGTSSLDAKFQISATTKAMLIGTASTMTPLYGSFLSGQANIPLEISANGAANNGGAALVMSNSQTDSGCSLGGISFSTSGTTSAEKRGALISSVLTASSASEVTASLSFLTNNNGSLAERMSIAAGGAVNVVGALSKGSGSFKIDHPLKPETHHLIHSFIEGPQADLIYRGKVELVDGRAEVNIDTVAGMTEGTFVALNREVQCFTSNESDWDAVRGSVTGNILTIECQNAESTATISWLVIGERQDQHMYDTDWTDENGKVIVEPLKPVEETVESTGDVEDSALETGA